MGVYRDKNRQRIHHALTWRVQIGLNNEDIFLGYCRTKKEAQALHDKYKKAILRDEWLLKYGIPDDVILACKKTRRLKNETKRQWLDRVIEKLKEGGI